MAEFKDQLAAAMERGNVKSKHLAIRLMVDTQQVGQWLRGERIPDADRQRDILSACGVSFDTVTWVVNEFRRDISERIDQFDADLQSAMVAKRSVTPALASAAQKAKGKPIRKAQ
jgi:transcriptional regulator with XRE-family HTH domain